MPNYRFLSITKMTNIPGVQHDPSQIAAETTPLLSQDPAHTKYSVFTNNQKRWIILTAALASSFSPFSANIYYPALNSIAKDLRVSSSRLNLTITTYMVSKPLVKFSSHDGCI